jgi:hypothetical protein
MKFPSIATLTGELLKTLRRWPLTILLAIIGTWFLMQTSNFAFIGAPDRRHQEYLWRIVDGCYMTMLLTIAATVFAEVKRLRVVFKICVLVLALLLGLAFYLTLPEESTPRLIRILVLGLALHWLVAVIPYAERGSGPNGFWDYNRKLFLRSLQTMLYTLTLYLGATLALLAIEHLFGVDVRSHIYEDVWWFLAGTFSTVFFLAGFPRVFARPESIDDYPRGLKVFTQFVLLPLVTLYLVILYAYLFKIVFTAHWPSGWVSWLVLGFAVAGIFALLLIYPLRKEEANLWINSYSRFFYLALFPLIVLLWIAIWKRIGSYGITEWRYYVMLLGIWLAVMAGYFVFSVGKDIRVIPASLCLLALLSLWGPWSAANVSLAAQMGRLRGILEKNGLFAGGKVQRAKAELSVDDRKAISSGIDYVLDRHGYRVFQPWFTNNLDSLMLHDRQIDADNYFSQPERSALLRLMNIDYVSRYGGDYVVAAKQEIECDLDGEKQALRLDSAGYVLSEFTISARSIGAAGEDRFVLPLDTAVIRFDTSRRTILVTLPRRRYVVSFDLLPLEKAMTDSAIGRIYFHLDKSTLTIHNGPETAYLTEVRGDDIGGKVRIMSVKGQVVLSKHAF